MAIATCEACGERYCTSCGSTEKDGTCTLCDSLGSLPGTREHQCITDRVVAKLILPLLPVDAADGGTIRTEAILARLNDVRILERAGWSLRASHEGLYCTPPEGRNFTVGQLRSMGISEGLVEAESRQGPRLRSPAEIDEATERLWDQYWYERHSRELDSWPTEEERLETAQILRELEQKHGREELLVEGDYELGKMLGKLSALVWLQGYAWDLEDFGIDVGPPGFFSDSK